MHRAQLVPLRLNKAQCRYMAMAAGTARFAYNWALAEWKRQAYDWWLSGKEKPYPTVYALQKQFNAIKREQFSWITEVAAEIPERAILTVGMAVEAYRSGGARYPKFKARGGRRSFVSGAHGRDIHIDGAHVTVPRVGRLRMASQLRWPDARPISAVVSERAGKWYIALCYSLPDREAARVEAYAGVDLGISSPLVVTSGSSVLHMGGDLAQRLNVERRKLRRANKRLHRRVKGSGRRWRARQAVSRIHYRMACIRSDMQHKATGRIAGMASRVGVETLAVRNMMANGRLARAIADVGFFEIKRQLTYKVDQVVEADRFYPSSKTCSSCGSIKQTLKLSDRIFRCEDCGHECDRDENAARNLEMMAANWVVSARGDGSSARKRKLTLRSLSGKREAGRSGAIDDEGER
jgi:putative transposase